MIYRVTNTRGNANYPSVVRVYQNGVLIGSVEIKAGNPLKYLREKKRSKHIDNLRYQCCFEHDMSEKDFDELVLNVRK